MKITLSHIHQKGFSLLHGKWGGISEHQSIIGLNGKEGLGEKSIGYLAYPNERGLKNQIPDRLFFYYEDFIFQDSIPTFDISYETSGELLQSVSKNEYLKKIARIKELLAAGEVYQINYAIRFRKKFNGEPYALFQKLNQINPVDFQAYINAGDFQIISSSPERFFSVREGKIVTQPIKGTAAKSEKCKEISDKYKNNFSHTTSHLSLDSQLEKLLNSPKERAELDMITDLERNDVGKICKYGTLKLNVERGVIELPNLWHCYSEVEGELREDIDFEQVVQAMLPSGSITGCPKKRAMEYIAELEGLPRNVYTGAIGFISDRSPIESHRQPIDSQFLDSEKINRPSTGHQPAINWNTDFNIAIRTILIKDGQLEFWAGGGIVADSDAEKEYEECMLKAERFLKII